MKRKHSDTYCLSTEKSQSLKLKLKKTTYTDPLKLTLKKSSVSEDFIVVSTNHSLEISNYSKEDVAGAEGKNEQTDTEETDNSIEQTFENVMVDQQVCFYRLQLFKSLDCLNYISIFYRMIMRTPNLNLIMIILWKKTKDHP